MVFVGRRYQNGIPKDSFLSISESSVGLNSSPFLLNATLKQHISQYQGVDFKFVTKMLNSYVNDLNSGENCVTDAFSFYQKAKSITSVGGFNRGSGCQTQMN